MEDYSPLIHTGAEAGGQKAQFTPAVRASHGVAETSEQARAIGEVQAALVVARANPRNEEASREKILNACQKIGLAEQARYRYPRAGAEVSGPSIRLAETMARHWMNLRYGFRELSRDGNHSELLAYCWDLETNVMAERRFVVRLARDADNKVKDVQSERDKYEVMASQAMRRVRACILEIIDGDLVDEAEQTCIATFQKHYGSNPEERRQKVVSAFQGVGVTKDQIERNLGHKIKDMTAAEFVRLKDIYNAIKDGVAAPGEFFVGGRREIAPPPVSTKPSPPREEEVSPQVPEPEEPPGFNEHMVDTYNPHPGTPAPTEPVGPPEEEPPWDPGDNGIAESGPKEIEDAFKKKLQEYGIKAGAFKTVNLFLESVKGKGEKMIEVKKTALDNWDAFWGDFQAFRDNRTGSGKPQQSSKPVPPSDSPAKSYSVHKKGPMVRYACPERTFMPVSEQFCSECPNRDGCEAEQE